MLTVMKNTHGQKFQILGSYFLCFEHSVLSKQGYCKQNQTAQNKIKNTIHHWKRTLDWWQFIECTEWSHQWRRKLAMPSVKLSDMIITDDSKQDDDKIEQWQVKRWLHFKKFMLNSDIFAEEVGNNSNVHVIEKELLEQIKHVIEF